MATDLQGWAIRQRAPFTLALAGTLVLSALVGWASQGRTLAPLALVPGQPWGLVTFPWAFSPLGSLIGTVFLLILVAFLLQFGGALEREMGTGRLLLSWVVASVAFGGLAVALGTGLAGPVLPGAALIVLWCARNRSARLMLWGLVPLSGAWMAGLTAASVIFTYGVGKPMDGVVLALPLILAWLYGRELLGLPVTGVSRSRRREAPVVKGGTRYDDAYYENVKKREIEREEQERLRKLFEGD